MIKLLEKLVARKRGMKMRKQSIQERIMELQYKLQTLKEMDINYRLSGADYFVHDKQYGHRYEFHPVSEEELRQWEKECNLILPEEYREYLKLMGYGTGPGYGLLSPDAVREANKQLLNSISYYVETADTGGWYEDRDFNVETGYGRITYFHELKKKHVNRYRRMLEVPVPEDFDSYMRGYYYSDMVPRVLSLEGAIIITKHGHLSYDVIIAEGEMAGTIWFMDKGVGQSMTAEPHGFFELGKPIPGAKKTQTFLTFMENWADQSLHKCKEIYSKKVL